MTNINNVVIMIMMVLIMVGCGSTHTSENELNPQYKFEVKDRMVLDFDIGQFISLINESRKEGAMCGTSYYAPTTPVIIDGRLVTSSLKKAYDLGTSGVFGHDGSGTNSDEFKAGVEKHFAKMIRLEIGSKKVVGENIAYGYSDVEVLHQAFMESPAHCRNVMNHHFNLIGISAYNDGYGNYYWAEHFSTAE